MKSVPDEIIGQLVERISVGVVLIDTEYKLVYWNKFMESHSDRGRDEVVGQDLFTTFPELPARWLQRKLRAVFTLKSYAFTSWQQRPFLFQLQHNRPITGGVEYMYQDCTLLPILDDQGNVEYVCIVVQDATDTSIYQKQLTEAQASLEYLSKYDGLTDLLNRRELESQLTSEFDRAQRYGGTFAVVLFDIDYFKRVNDTFGHHAGDEVLRCVAKVAKDTARVSDVVARYGGEEFVVIAINTDVDGAVRLAERLRLAVAALSVDYEDKSIAVTISVGVSGYRDGMTDHEELFREADVALYQSKAGGRNLTTLHHLA